MVGFHQFDHGLLAIVDWATATHRPIVIALSKPVAFPVGDPPALLPAEHQIDGACEEASTGYLKPLKLMAVAAVEQTTGMVFKHSGKPAAAHESLPVLSLFCRLGAVGQRQIEIHFIQPLAWLEISESAVS